MRTVVPSATLLRSPDSVAARSAAPAARDVMGPPRPSCNRTARWITRAHALGLALAGALFAACDAGPLAVQADRGVVTRASGVEKAAISGTIQFLGVAPPGRSLVTSSGRCHNWDAPVTTTFTGDVAGVVTFFEQQHGPCDFSDLVASGPFEGQVTWNGRSGTIAGQWTTNCDADSSQPLGLSCDGTTNARGSGGLEGVQFHFKWGPGWYPFAYTGTAFSR